MNTMDEPQIQQCNVIECVRHCLDEAHRTHAASRRPFVTVTYAQSLDGSIAHARGQTLKLSNDRSLELTHQMRAIHDAILVGINTVVRDNPCLTVRLTEGKNPQPIIVDGRLRFPLDANLLKDRCVRPIIVTSHDACRAKEQRLLDAGAKVIRVAQDAAGLLDLQQLFERVKQLGLRSVMVEGGARVITSLLTSHLADQYLITISPRLVGGLRSIRAQSDAEPGRFARLCNLHYQWLAGNLIIRGDLEPDDEPSGNGDVGCRRDTVASRESAHRDLNPAGNGSEPS
jgi:3,4-dihydroxy 2-butanone 4-phosphate synthase/GTP cyclohydrolase II